LTIETVLGILWMLVPESRVKIIKRINEIFCKKCGKFEKECDCGKA
jgi:hypothetical protein